MEGPPDEVRYELEEADEFLRDLELARDALDDLGAIGPLAGIESQIKGCTVNWASTKEDAGEHRLDP